MNPFKHKHLTEFTIEDCELYIRKYPYGEHASEVKRKLRELKTQNETQSNAEDSSQKQFEEDITQINEDIDSASNFEEDAECDEDKDPPKDIVKNIFAWIGLIAVVLVIGTILSKVVPEHLWNKYRYLVYPAAGALGRWLQKELNW